MIDILIPVLNRPHRAQEVYDHAVGSTLVDVRVNFICSPNDTAQIAACQATGARVLIAPHRPTRADYPRKMNQGFHLTDREWVLLAADDVTFQPGWAEHALAADDGQVAVIGTNDQANPQFRHGLSSTHPLVRRRYVTEHGGSLDGPGHLLHEGYDHNFCERELCHLAQHRGVYIYARDAHLTHRHPHFTHTGWDDTYRKGMRRFQTDHQLFVTRAPGWANVGLSPNDIRRQRNDIRRGNRRSRA